MKKARKEKQTWDQIEGRWKQMRGKALQRWGKLMKDELDMLAGKHEELVGRLQEKYGIARNEAERRSAKCKTIINKSKRVNSRVSKNAKSLRNKGKGKTHTG